MPARRDDLTAPAGGDDPSFGLDIALAHAALGRRVFPFLLLPRAGRGFDKKPLVKWKGVATTDEAPIRGWWHRWPKALPGWVLPEGLGVVDVDDPAAFEAAGLALPETAHQSTPSGGSHWLYATEGRPVRQTVKEVPGADTRVGGKGWVGLYALDSFDGEVVAVPRWLSEERARAPDAPWADREPSVVTEAFRTKRLYIAAGQRDDDIASIAGSLLIRPPKEMAELAINLLNLGGVIEQPRGDPFGPKEIQRIVGSIAKAEGEKRAGRRALVAIPLSDVPTSEPAPLRLGYLDPADHTILFGDGGTGKGVVTAWWVALLSLQGELVLILDYERHARFEWRPRVEAFGGDLNRVFIVEPTEAIWDVVDELAREVERVSATWLVVDSVGYACIGAEVEKSATAIRYSAAVAQIGLPTASLAHTTKSDADPRHPFGSVFWSNGARMTIGMTGVGRERRVLTNKKTNQRAPFAPVAIDWDWIDSGLPSTLVERSVHLTVGDRAYVALGENGSMTIEELAAAVSADGGGTAKEDSVQRALLRDSARFRGDGGKPQRWSRFLRIRRVPIQGAE